MVLVSTGPEVKYFVLNFCFAVKRPIYLLLFCKAALKGPIVFVPPGQWRGYCHICDIKPIMGRDVFFVAFIVAPCGLTILMEMIMISIWVHFYIVTWRREFCDREGSSRRSKTLPLHFGLEDLK